MSEWEVIRMRTGKIKIKKKEEKRFTSEKYQHWELVVESHLLEKAVSFRKSSFLKQQSGRGAGGLLRFPLDGGDPPRVSAARWLQPWGRG